MVLPPSENIRLNQLYVSVEQNATYIKTSPAIDEVEQILPM